MRKDAPDANQIELSFSVIMCAWCRPQARHGSAGLQSHGICPRHLKKLKGKLNKTEPFRPARPPNRRGIDSDSLFPF